MRILSQTIRLTIDIQNSKFNGITELVIDSCQEGKIVLDCDNSLSINECRIFDSPASFSHHCDLLIITADRSDASSQDGDPLTGNDASSPSPRALSAPLCKREGRVKVWISYQGRIVEYPCCEGVFFPDQCKSQVLTMLQPDLASKAFPCIQSPSDKTVYKLHLSLPDGYSAISNTRREQGERNGGGEVSFGETMPMPYYVFGFYVYRSNMPFTRKSLTLISGGRLDLGINQRGCVADQVFDILADAVNSLEDMFGMPFPSDKLDVIFAPIHKSSMSLGMENHGMIVLSGEINRHSDWTNTSDYTKVVTTVIHEVVHHYIGNVATCADWSHLWFNEGVTTWLSHLIVDSLYPGLRVKWDVLTDGRWNALTFDSTKSVHPVICPVPRFDVITYDKTCFLLNMLESYLGTRDLLGSIRQLVLRPEWRCVDLRIFCDAILEVTGEDVYGMLEGWFTHSGVSMSKVEAGPKSLVVTNDSLRIPLRFHTGRGSEAICKADPTVVIVSGPEGEAPRLIHRASDYHFLIINDFSRVSFPTPLDQADFIRQAIILMYQDRYSLPRVYNYVSETVARTDQTDHFVPSVVLHWLDEMMDILGGEPSHSATPQTPPPLGVEPSHSAGGPSPPQAPSVTGFGAINHPHLTGVASLLERLAKSVLSRLEGAIDWNTPIGEGYRLKNLAFVYGGKYGVRSTVDHARIYADRYVRENSVPYAEIKDSWRCIARTVCANMSRSEMLESLDPKISSKLGLALAATPYGDVLDVVLEQLRKCRSAFHGYRWIDFLHRDHVDRIIDHLRRSDDGDVSEAYNRLIGRCCTLDQLEKLLETGKADRDGILARMGKIKWLHSNCGTLIPDVPGTGPSD